MRICIDNINTISSFKYRLMFVCGAVVHLWFLIEFQFIGVEELAVVNIFSVLLYILGSFFSVNKQTGTMYYGWMLAFFSEIMIHTVLCMLLIGLDADFYLYLLVILPISVYVLYFSCRINVFIKTICVFILISMTVGSGSVMLVNSLECFPMFPLSYDDIDSLRMINMVAAAVMLVAFSLLFALEVHVLVRNLGDANKKLEYIATRDKLTGLYNRHSIKSMYEELEKSERSFCVVLGDVDDFKKINDTYGHDCGDVALKTIADIISGGIAEGDIACRWGGEELLLVLCGSREEAFARLESINEAIRSAEIRHGESVVTLTMTFGFAHKTEAEGLDALVSLVDKRLYYGKRNGKNTIIS